MNLPRRRRLVRAFVLLVVLVGGPIAWSHFRAELPEPGPMRQVGEFVLFTTSGELYTRASWKGHRAVVLFFLGTECPVSNGYVPEMRRLAEAYRPRGVAFVGVYPDPEVSARQALEHARAYGLGLPLVLDPGHELAAPVGVNVTPEAAVLDSRGVVLYRGRIDDRYDTKGRPRSVVKSHDLRDALEAVLSGHEPADEATEAFGCPLPTARLASGDRAVTFARDVAPIVWRHCAGCHRPGQVAPFSLLSYHDAAKRARFLLDVVENGRMPPWKPVPGFGEFRGENRLSRREKAILASWVESGAPEGDPAELPPPPRTTDGWHLGRPDLVLTMPEPYTIPEDGPDLYRAFVLPIPLDHDQGVAAVEFLPGNRRVVHHARLYHDATPQSRDRDAGAPGLGFPTGGNDIPKPGLGVWIPGTVPQPSPPGVGYVIKAGSDLVAMIHYHPTGKVETDVSQIGLYFSREPIIRRMATIPLSTVNIDIPAGASRHRIALQARVPANVHAYHVLPHGHLLLRSIKLWANLPDGATRRLLWIDDWDFNWQGLYHFAEPVALPEGTILHVVAVYDNSAANPFNPHHPPQRVRFGRASTDEMLGCHVGILPDQPSDEQVIWAKWPFSL